MSTDFSLTRLRGGWPSRAFAILSILFLTACADDDDDDDDPLPPAAEDRAYYILPPGNYGGLDATSNIIKNATDQLVLYDGLTPLRGNVTDGDIEQFFLPQNFQPIGETNEEVTGRPGTTIVYDEYGIPHITGDTREDLAFGAGWVTMKDRSLLINFGRQAARIAIADIPNVNAFRVLLEVQSYVPSEEVEQLVTDQVELLKTEFGAEGEEIIADAQAYADGMNAYIESSTGQPNPDPFTVNDVVSVTAFIGSIFGAGGGAEYENAEFLATLVAGLGDGPGQEAWEDAMLFDDPEAPTTLDIRFDYGPLTGGGTAGSAVIDAGSVALVDPVMSAGPTVATGPQTDPTLTVPRRLEASNWLLADTPASSNGNKLAVMGPQLGYYYPEIVMQLHLSSPAAGIEAQGVAVPGLAMYILIGRTPDYAWSLTSAGHDVKDVYAELLCNPDGSPATEASVHYEYNGECEAFASIDGGTLNGDPISYLQSVHGNVIGYATSEGRPVALTLKRSTFGRDALNLAGLKDMTEGDAATPEAFYQAANKFGFTFNWGYASRSNIAYFSSGYLPVRAAGLDRRLPTWGTGDYEWQGFLAQEQHPHAAQGPSGRLLNWNNQAAPGFMHGDDTPYGSVHRLDLFDQWSEQTDLAGVVNVMNRSATEDTRTPAWPAIIEVLRGSEAPTPLAGQVIDILDAWVADDAPRLDADEDGFFDEAAPTIMDALFEPLVREVMGTVFTGDLIDALNEIRGLSGRQDRGSVGTPAGASYLDKDLRTVLGQEVQGRYNNQYCGAGDLDTCRADLWAVVDDVSQTLALERGDDPTTWLMEAPRLSFAPLVPLDANGEPASFRPTNRPTFQQVLEFTP